MTLEKFLSRRIPSSRKILHEPSVDLEWNVGEAYDLMEHVCHIIIVLEKNKRYSELSNFLEKKEIYLKLRNELEELVDKHHFRKQVGRYAFLDNSDEAYGDQTDLHFHNYLKHADLLVAHDIAWRRVLLHDD